MSKITTLDKKALIVLRPEINAALVELGAKYGLKFDVGNGSYAGANAQFKLEIKVDDPRVQADREREVFNRNCAFVNLRPEDFGAVFQLSGKRMELVGFAPTRVKYPLKVKDVATGKIVLYTDGIVDRIRAATDAARKAA